MIKTIKSEIREVKATDLALLAAVVGPKANAIKAIEAAMRLYLQAAVELDGINGRHIEELLIRYFSVRDGSMSDEPIKFLDGGTLFKQWRKQNTIDDKGVPTLKHYPDAERDKDPAWQWVYSNCDKAERFGKRPGALVSELKKYIRKHPHFELRQELDGEKRKFYAISENLLSAFAANSPARIQRRRKKGAERARRYRAKPVSSRER